jgi:hypothetical protein
MLSTPDLTYQFPARVALHSLRLAIARVVIRPAALVAHCRARSAREAASEAAVAAAGHHCAATGGKAHCSIWTSTLFRSVY